MPYGRPTPGAARADAMPTEERMADVNTREKGSRTGGSTMLLGLLLLAVLVLVVWIVMRGGEDTDVDINVPNVESPDVEIKGSGDGK
ncbi:MAG TPA: hypothetical protein VFY65_01225 [Longimicrobium sp.]|nr:hypothetical protein [Longimicrobium sp.]